jgi:DNA-binding PadR family transcriptional regulator
MGATMSVRQGLLALLAEQPMYGYQLRGEFEARTGGTWPLNIGQVYTTLGRLERDGLVTPAGASDDGNERYALTDEGRAEVGTWWATPVPRDAPGRDELAIKLALAVTVPGVDVRGVVQRQRTETLRSLQAYTRLKTREAEDGSRELAWRLVLDNLVFAAEAEVRWLDHVEARLARSAADRPADDRTAPRQAPSSRRVTR